MWKLLIIRVKYQKVIYKILEIYLNEINNWLASQINFELKYVDFNSIGNYNRVKKDYSFTLNSSKLQKKLKISIKKIDLKKDCIKFSKKINFMLN